MSGPCWTSPADWTPERIDTLKKLWNQGKSAAQIAKALGPGVSRSAVTGKVDRLRKGGDTSIMARRAGGRSGVGRTHAEEARRAMAPAAPTAPRAVAKAETGSPLRGQDVEAIDLPPEELGEEACTLLELGAHMCKWPIGNPEEPGLRFCGRRVRKGSYCDTHVRVAYQPPSKSKRKSVFNQSPNELARALRRWM